MEEQTKGPSQRCRKCGCHIPINTLEFDLHNLIIRFGIAELLDRVGSGIEQQREFENDSAIKQAWREVEICLEKAVEAALELATLQADKEVPFWR